MTEQSITHIALAYLAVINVATFFVYGIDKWRSTSGRSCLQPGLNIIRYSNGNSKKFLIRFLPSSVIFCT